MTQAPFINDEEYYPEDRLVGAGAMLALDIGTINTRAALFDTVGGHYRFVAGGVSASTAGAPMFDVGEGVRNALDHIHRVSGRALVSEDEQILIPSTFDGAGVDYLAATLSGVRPLKVVAVGLLEQVSLASAKSLADTTYSEIVDTISLNQKEGEESQIDAILRIKPDVILIAGGTDGGAKHSVLKMVNSIGMALYLMAEHERPEVLYVGNNELTEQVKTFLEPLTTVHIGPNIRPGLTVEWLGPAQRILSTIFRRIIAVRVLGVQEIDGWAGGNLLPSAYGLGRIARFFSLVVPSELFLAVDIGATYTTVAAGFRGDLRLKVNNNLGMGLGLKGLLAEGSLPDVIRWIPMEVSQDYILNYIQNKIIYPQTIPATVKDLAVEQALAREVLRLAIRKSEKKFPRNAKRLNMQTLPLFDPIMVGGGVISQAPILGQSMLMILDALQPTGVQQIILDKNGLAPMLGATAAVHPTMTTQILSDSVALPNLGYVISPVSQARQGTEIVRVRIKYENGQENVFTARKGEIVRIPLSLGSRAKLFIDPLHRANIGRGPGRGISGYPVIGGPFGVVIDARGRPIELPSKPERRFAVLRRWTKVLSQ